MSACTSLTNMPFLSFFFVGERNTWRNWTKQGKCEGVSCRENEKHYNSWWKRNKSPGHVLVPEALHTVKLSLLKPGATDYYMSFFHFFNISNL